MLGLATVIGLALIPIVWVQLRLSDLKISISHFTDQFSISSLAIVFMKEAL